MARVGAASEARCGGQGRLDGCATQRINRAYSKRSMEEGKGKGCAAVCLPSCTPHMPIQPSLSTLGVVLAALITATAQATPSVHIPRHHDDAQRVVRLPVSHSVHADLVRSRRTPSAPVSGPNSGFFTVPINVGTPPQTVHSVNSMLLASFMFFE